MQYTINEIHGGEIKVTFDDKSWASVRVDKDDTPELIDEKVGAFTSEYTYKEEANTNIKVGDVRTTVNPVVAQQARDAAAKEEAAKNAANQADAYFMNWGNTNSYMEPFTTYMLALKLAAGGDSSLLDLINARIQSIQDDPEFSLDDLKAAFNDTV